jgi:hypothetical protein
VRRPLDRARACSTANVAGDLDRAAFADTAANERFVAGQLRARFESERGARERFLVGLRGRQGDARSGPIELDAQLLRRDNAIAADVTRGVHVADLASAKQYAHPRLLRGSAMSAGTQCEQHDQSEQATHGKSGRWRARIVPANRRRGDRQTTQASTVPAERARVCQPSGPSNSSGLKRAL